MPKDNAEWKILQKSKKSFRDLEIFLQEANRSFTLPAEMQELLRCKLSFVSEELKKASDSNLPFEAVKKLKEKQNAYQILLILLLEAEKAYKILNKSC